MNISKAPGEFPDAASVAAFISAVEKEKPNLEFLALATHDDSSTSANDLLFEDNGTPASREEILPEGGENGRLIWSGNVNLRDGRSSVSLFRTAKEVDGVAKDFVKAVALTDPRRVDYFDEAHCHQTKTGGTRSWRNNNPGNINCGQFANAHGAIGCDSNTQPTAAIFPSLKVGTEAQIALLRAPAYQALRVGEAMDRWTGVTNNTGYRNGVESRSGVAMGRQMSSLSGDELLALTDGMRFCEGFEEGASSELLCPPELQSPVALVKAAIVKQAVDEWIFWGRSIPGSIAKRETNPTVLSHIENYWSVGVEDPHAGDFETPWSAAFISWCMRTGEAGDAFHYSGQHSVYISRAIQDARSGNSAAAFLGFRLTEYVPTIGDLVCWAREPGISYLDQQGGDYAGHSDVVVAVNSGNIEVIGGNVSQSVTRRHLATNANGFLLPAGHDEYLIAIMQNRLV